MAKVSFDLAPGLAGADDAVVLPPELRHSHSSTTSGRLAMAAGPSSRDASVDRSGAGSAPWVEPCDLAAMSAAAFLAVTGYPGCIIPFAAGGKQRRPGFAVSAPRDVHSSAVQIVSGLKMRTHHQIRGVSARPQRGCVRTVFTPRRRPVLQNRHRPSGGGRWVIRIPEIDDAAAPPARRSNLRHVNASHPHRHPDRLHLGVGGD